MARRWAPTVCSSPRATGPVSAASGPSATQLSTVRLTSGARRRRASAGLSPASPATSSAIAWSVTRKFDATDAAAWYAARLWSGSSKATIPSRSAISRAAASASGVDPAIAQPIP